MSYKTFDKITVLGPGEVFVFGSNERGFHGAGAAGLAMRNDSRNNWRQDKSFLAAMKSPKGSPARVGHWAIFGIGRGHQVGHNGESYAIATVTKPGARKSIPLKEISSQLGELMVWAKAHPEKTIYCAINGGGYNGWSKEEIASCYPTDIPENVFLPKDLIPFLSEGEEIMYNKTYAGIGSRETPRDILNLMARIAEALARQDWILRSGGAKGADSAFEKGAGGWKEIYTTEDCEEWCLKTVEKFVPANRPPLCQMKPYVQKLLGRNMKQVFGPDGKTPSRFIICWTPDGKDSGGTGYAIRAAQDANIPVFNLQREDHRRRLEKFVEKGK